MNRMKYIAHKSIFGILIIIALLTCIISYLRIHSAYPIPTPAGALERVPQSVKPKVLFVDSYHKGYQWSEGILNGVLSVFNGTLSEMDNIDCAESSVNLRIVRMDTKRNQSETFMSQAGIRVKELIDAWHPDVVITSDDNAARYVIVPNYINTDLPFVFCGINWDASGYGFPCSNVTGMVEVDLVDNMLSTMQRYARGTRIGILGADNVSNRKAADNYVNKLGLTLNEKVFVHDLAEMKNAFLELQDKVDMLILMPPSFIDNDTDAADAHRFMLENTTIITGSVESWIAPYTLFCFSKSSEELGMWAASTALKILEGTDPADIPITQNQQANMHLNMAIAKSMNIIFPVDMLEQATITTE